MKEQALAEYSDETALAVQGQRATLQTNLKLQKQQIIQSAAARGFGADSPEVQQQLMQADMGGLDQLGKLAGSAALQFNDTQAKIRMTYDEMGTRVRGLQDQLGVSTRAAADKYVGLSQAQGAELQAKVAQLNETLELASAQEARQIEQMRAQNSLSADQLELAGATTMASLLRDWDLEMAPMAPIVSLAAKMTADLKTRASLSSMAVNAGLRATVPSPGVGYSQGSGVQSQPAAGQSEQGMSPAAQSQLDQMNQWPTEWGQNTELFGQGGAAGAGPAFGSDLDPAGELSI